MPKDIRDRIQNHALQDVNSKSYDRWTYLPEKRAGGGAVERLRRCTNERAL